MKNCSRWLRGSRAVGGSCLKKLHANINFGTLD